MLTFYTATIHLILQKYQRKFTNAVLNVILKSSCHSQYSFGKDYT